MEAAAEDPLRKDFKSKSKKAFILGYTGGVGRALVEDLVEEALFQKIVLIGRREVPMKDGEKYACIEQKVIDFEKLEEHKSAFSGCDVGYCCLGTTRSKAGKAGFIKVDHDYVVNSAQIAKEEGCKEFHVVTSQGADASSSLLYIRVKGEVENELKELQFERLFIYRPGFLYVERDEFRCGECFFKCCCAPLKCCLGTAMTMPGNVLTSAMICKTITPSGDPDVHWECLDNRTIHQLGKQ